MKKVNLKNYDTRDRPILARSTYRPAYSVAVIIATPQCPGVLSVLVDDRNHACFPRYFELSQGLIKNKLLHDPGNHVTTYTQTETVQPWQRKVAEM